MGGPRRDIAALAVARVARRESRRARTTQESPAPAAQAGAGSAVAIAAVAATAGTDSRLLRRSHQRSPRLRPRRPLNNLCAWTQVLDMGLATACTVAALYRRPAWHGLHTESSVTFLVAGA